MIFKKLEDFKLKIPSRVVEPAFSFYKKSRSRCVDGFLESSRPLSDELQDQLYNLILGLAVGGDDEVVVAGIVA